MRGCVDAAWSCNNKTGIGLPKQKVAIAQALSQLVEVLNK